MDAPVVVELVEGVRPADAAASPEPETQATGKSRSRSIKFTRSRADSMCLSTPADTSSLRRGLERQGMSFGDESAIAADRDRSNGTDDADSTGNSTPKGRKRRVTLGVTLQHASSRGAAVDPMLLAEAAASANGSFQQQQLQPTEPQARGARRPLRRSSTLGQMDSSLLTKEAESFIQTVRRRARAAPERRRAPPGVLADSGECALQATTANNVREATRRSKQATASTSAHIRTSRKVRLSSKASSLIQKTTSKSMYALPQSPAKRGIVGLGQVHWDKLRVQLNDGVKGARSLIRPGSPIAAEHSGLTELAERAEEEEEEEDYEEEEEDDDEAEQYEHTLVSFLRDGLFRCRWRSIHPEAPWNRKWNLLIVVLSLYSSIWEPYRAWMDGSHTRGPPLCPCNCGQNEHAIIIITNGNQAPYHILSF